MFTTKLGVSPENRKTIPSGIGRLDKFTWKLEVISGYNTIGDIKHKFNFTRFQCLAERKKKEGNKISVEARHLESPGDVEKGSRQKTWEGKGRGS